MRSITEKLEVLTYYLEQFKFTTKLDHLKIQHKRNNRAAHFKLQVELSRMSSQPQLLQTIFNNNKSSS